MQDDLLHGTISCVQVVNGFLSTIQNKKRLNAFLSVYADEAVADALRIDQKLKNGKAGKLAGLVVGLKDVFAHQHHPLTAGSKILNGFTSPYNATIVQRLIDEDAGRDLGGRQRLGGEGARRQEPRREARRRGRDPAAPESL